MSEPQSSAEAAKGSANREIHYVCGTCGHTKPRADLLAKRVTFTTLKPVKLVRSRTVGWICSTCRTTDPAWTQPSFRAAPGYVGTSFQEGQRGA